jgi:4-hydroxybenzoate polyprenyltransferase
VSKSLSHYLGLVRFSHTLFALPFALSSATIAWSIESFRFVDLIGILLCMIFARSAAMAFNRLVDRHIDAQNPRTATRHLPTGLLSTRRVRAFTLLTSIGFIASTTLFLLREPPNFWPLILSVPVLIFLLLYSYTKRFTSLAHFWLGVSLMLAPISAWIAIVGLRELLPPVLLGAGVLFWVAGFDILYACQDADFDRKKGLHSIPARFGIRGALQLAALSHAFSLIFFLSLYWLVPQLNGWIYLIGVTAVVLLLVYEHSLVKADDLSKVNQAFFQVNIVISVGMFLIILAQILFRSDLNVTF